jgi:hypothetical protein
MKKIILHVGTHKTGTTSFQKSMETNVEALLQQDIRPIFGQVFRNDKPVLRKRANHVHFSHLLLRPDVLTGARYRRSVPVLSNAERHRDLETFAQELLDCKEETLLISSEGLCFLRTAEEQNLLYELARLVGRDLRTFIVFRNDTEWRNSWNNQLQKNKSGLFEKVSAENPDISIVGEWYFDKSAIQKFWEPFNLTKIDYDMHPNIVQTLYHEMGVSIENFETEFFTNLRS